MTSQDATTPARSTVPISAEIHHRMLLLLDAENIQRRRDRVRRKRVQDLYEDAILEYLVAHGAMQE